MTSDNTPWPTAIDYKPADKVLRVAFDNGNIFHLPAEYLRVESPSAEVQGHNPSERQLVAGRRHVGITGMEPVGNYAIRIIFDDLHDTGIYSWRYLHELGVTYLERWERYVADLVKAGLHRDP